MSKESLSPVDGILFLVLFVFSEFKGEGFSTDDERAIVSIRFELQETHLFTEQNQVPAEEDWLGTGCREESAEPGNQQV